MATIQAPESEGQQLTELGQLAILLARRWDCAAQLVDGEAVLRVTGNDRVAMVTCRPVPDSCEGWFAVNGRSPVRGFDDAAEEIVTALWSWPGSDGAAGMNQ